MLRNPTALIDGEFDLLVIGGGAFGAAAAWDATLRGLRTALIERSDFGGGASAECFKMVHGGIRYLQHGDVKRLRSSCNERSAFLRIAPHLVTPLPIVIPTYGYGRQGKPFLGAGMCLYDLLTLGRNEGIRDRTRRIPPTRFLDKGEVLDAFPDLEQRSLTGAAIFDDGQMYNPARLVLAFAHSAARAGATVCNYAEATKFLWQGKRVIGAQVRDRLDGATFDVRAKLVLNAAGPWAEYLLQDGEHFGHWDRGPFSRDAYFVVDRKPRTHYALAVPGQTRDRDALVSRAARHLFAVPWRDYTLIGVWHKLFAQRPDTAEVEEKELQAWLAEINASYPSLQLRREDVVYANCGLVPFGDGKTAENELSFGKESRFIDHRREQGVEGLLTLIGIRYTTARGDSAKALDMLLQQMPNAPGRAATDSTPLIGGDIADFAALRAQAQADRPTGVSAESLDALLRNHGTEYRMVLEIARTASMASGGKSEAGMISGNTSRAANGAAARGTQGHSNTLLAEVDYAVQSEMAVRVEDVVLRRTDLGSGAHPGHEAVERVADRMQQLLKWPEERRLAELQATQQVLRRHRAGSSATDSAYVSTSAALA